MSDRIYTEGDYLKNNPTWHAEDSPRKAAHILQNWHWQNEIGFCLHRSNSCVKFNELAPMSLCVEEIKC